MKKNVQLKRLDGIELMQHVDLDMTDVCYYWNTYTPGDKYNNSKENSLIHNFKKRPTEVNKSKQMKAYKENAILELAKEFSSVIKRDETYLQSTFVPVPPSKVKDDPDYDDRLVKLLIEVSRIRNIQMDIRSIISQNKNTVASTKANKRLSINELIMLYTIDESQIYPIPNRVFIFDDLITKGSHFKAMSACLGKIWPQSEIIGLFIAQSSYY